jgi:hypothetical protein
MASHVGTWKSEIPIYCMYFLCIHIHTAKSSWALDNVYRHEKAFTVHIGWVGIWRTVFLQSLSVYFGHLLIKL